MTLISVDTPLGPGEVFVLKDHVRHLSLPQRQMNGAPLKISVQGLGDMDGAAHLALADCVTAAMTQAQPWLDEIPNHYAIALDYLKKSGLPAELPIEMAVWKVTVAAAENRKPDINVTHPVTMMFLVGNNFVSLYLNAHGETAILLSPEQLNDVFTASMTAARRSAATPITHPVFGSFKPAELQTLKRKMVNRKRVAIDLYLPDAKADTIASSDLDPFVSLFETLPDLVDPVRKSALSCKADWLADLLDPVNAHLHPALLRVFPQAQSNGIDDATFLDALWISRICLAPFGTGPSRPEPCATWDLHALPKGKDDTIFAVKTTPDGRVIEAALES